ncbi:MAG: cytidine deaminase [Alcanivoracaceae bacterium]|nr:cytidine deaminase [Alcanivoracaceae bacterium]
MNIELDLYHQALSLLKQRYPDGWGGAAAIRTETGKILTSVAPEVNNNALALCIEVGAFLETYKLNESVTHCICVVRDNECSEIRILTPCGICQERLRYWGAEVKVGVTNPENEILFKKLYELQPYHWSGIACEKKYE